MHLIISKPLLIKVSIITTFCPTNYIKEYQKIDKFQFDNSITLINDYYIKSIKLTLR